MLALCLSLGGCYTFAAAAPEALPAGTRVRVSLSEDGASALEPVVGASVSGVEGEVTRVGGDTLLVRADKLLTTPGVDVAWTGRDLALPAAWRRTVGRRRLAVGRTTALAAGGVALSVAVIALVRAIGDRQGDSGIGGDPIQVFRGAP